MGRGTQGQVQNQGNTLLGQEGTNAQTNQNNAQTGYNFLMPAYQSMYSNPGYTDAQKTAITNDTLGGLGAAYGAASSEATNRAARTNNAAGLNANQDALALDRMRTAASANAANQTNFANAARSDQRTALGGINSLYGTSTGAGLGYTGQENSTLGTLSNNAARMKQGGFWNNFMNGLGSGLAGAAVGVGGTGASMVGSGNFGW